MNNSYSCPARSSSGFPEVPTVYVVDPDASMCAALTVLVRSAGWQARTHLSAEEFLARPPTMTPSCLLAELQLPGASGLDLQERVSDRIEMPMIFMSRSSDVKATVQAMKAGAFEFLTKPVENEVLLHAIGAAIERSRTTLRQLERTRDLRKRYESLSPREREVMGLVVSGRLNKQVGGELGISEITVKAHRGKMMRKMQAGSFAELVNMAVRLRRNGIAADAAESDDADFVAQPGTRLVVRHLAFQASA